MHARVETESTQYYHEWTVGISMLIKSNSGKNSERRPGKKASIIGEYISNHEQNVGRNMDVKGHSVRSQAEMRNMLLETEEKAIFVIKWQITWLNDGLQLW